MFKSNQGLVNGIRNARKIPREMAIFWSTFDQLHSLRVDRFGVAVQTESEGADHCGGISLGGAWFWKECTAQHQREEAERHFVPESEERHVAPLRSEKTLLSHVTTGSLVRQCA